MQTSDTSLLELEADGSRSLLNFARPSPQRCEASLLSDMPVSDELPVALVTIPKQGKRPRKARRKQGLAPGFLQGAEFSKVTASCLVFVGHYERPVRFYYGNAIKTNARAFQCATNL